MQRNPHKHIGERLQVPPRPLSLAKKTEGNSKCGVRHNYTVSSSPRARLPCTCLSRPGLNRCSRHGYVVPATGEKWRRNYANKEMLRRALRASQQNRSLTLRWWNFRPTPSRLSNMSMA